ncbi:hypothetical protein SESBI_15959 [Sesbania bispinosa]|nr:hypothetical protein SESBI_15959 [Sesbania bispinosa]
MLLNPQTPLLSRSRASALLHQGSSSAILMPLLVGFTWVRRSENKVAHSLAQYALRGDFFPASSSCWPSDIQSHVAKERQLASSYNLHRDLGFALAASDVAHEPPLKRLLSMSLSLGAFLLDVTFF